MISEIVISAFVLFSHKYQPPANTENFQNLQVSCLAKNIYFEARNQTVLGQIAVAQVTLNRVRSKRFPDDVCSVVYQAHLKSNGIPKRNRCAFSWFCDGLNDDIHNKKVYNEIYKLAERVYNEKDIMIDITGGATHYYGDYIKPPYWAKYFRQTVKINNHIFFTSFNRK